MHHKRLITPIKLAAAALLVLLVSNAQAEWKNLVQSQGNNVGLTVSTAYGGPMRGGTPSQFPRGSGNTYKPGRWNWGINAARDTNGDGVANDTVSNLSRAGYFPGMLCALEAYDLLSSLAAAGEDMEDASSRISTNRIWTSSDPDDLSDWPAQFREGRSASGAPILHGAETIVANNGDCFRDGSVLGGSIEWRFHFLNFAESNDMVYAHVFFRNMSEYIRWNPYPSNTDKIAGTAETGQTWIGMQINYNYGNGFLIGGRDEAWAYYFPREICAIADRDGVESSFTTHPAMVAMQMLRRPQYKDQELLFTNCLAHGWSTEYGAISPQEVQEGGYPMGKAYRYGNGRYDPTAPFYPDDTNPITDGGPLYGWPGVLIPGDTRYEQWIWGTANAYNSYNTWGEYHNVAPRDSFSLDAAYAFVQPANPPFTFPPSDIANMDNPVVQEQLAPILNYMDVAKVVYEGGFVLPETPQPPPLTIVPGDKQVTITWSDVNIHTPDAYYAFLQQHPELDPGGSYVEYDFEGYRLYRSYVGPSDSHSELIWEGSLSGGDLAFYYVDTRDADNPLFRMNNGMRVWYALVPYDKNYDPSTGDVLSLPDPASGKLWNRAGAQLYTVQPRSEASNFKAMEFGSIQFNSHSSVTAQTTMTGTATLTGDGSGNLTQDPIYLEPAIGELEIVPIIAEKKMSDFTVTVAVANTSWTYGSCNRPSGLATLQLTEGSNNGPETAPLAGRGDVTQNLSVMGPVASDGVSYSVDMTFNHMVSRNHGSLNTWFDVGSWSGGSVNVVRGGCTGRSPGGLPGAACYTTNGKFTITWKDAGNGELSIDVVNSTHNKTVPYTEYFDDLGGEGWGFWTQAGYGGAIGDGDWNNGTYTNEWRNGVPRAERSVAQSQTIPADNTEHFAIWLNGLPWRINIDGGMPSAGTVWTVTNAFGVWNGDQTEFTQYPDMPWTGDSWTIQVKGTTMNAEDADLSKIMVVPNPYMASSALDLSPSQRRIEFVNLPARCTIRIYSLGGHLVNVLNHIGANRHGWGNYLDWDRLNSDGDPREFEGWDNHGGTEAWNLQNRFGQTVASGLYFYHVTDERGETHTGKFYVIN